MAQSDTPTDLDATFYQEADRFFRAHAAIGLTYDDVTLATRYSEIAPRATRLDTRLSESLMLHTPILSADMDTVTEAAMAVGMARNGGMGLIHANLSDRAQLKEVARVKNDVHGLIQEPITVGPELLIGDVLALIDEKGYKFRTFPVVEADGRFVGLLRGRIVKERYKGVRVSEAMTVKDDVYTILDSAIADDPIRHADDFFNQHMGIHKLIVLDAQGALQGLFTMSDIERIREEETARVRPARDDQFRLVCGAALSPRRRDDGAIDRDAILGHAHNLVDEGVDALAVSTAHGHTSGVGEIVRLLREAFPALTLIAGNVTSAEAVTYLAACGADAIKIGQGPGSICTTRLVAGVGIPQLTALYVCARAARAARVRIIADGGINKSGDMVKALTLADAVMCGGMLAGCREAPGDVLEINGQAYKRYRGMGSRSAMKAGSAARYGHNSREAQQEKSAAEGVEALKEVSGGLDDILRELRGGIQSGLGYLGAADLHSLQSQARYLRVSPAALREAAPHDIVEVKTTTSEAS